MKSQKNVFGEEVKQGHKRRNILLCGHGIFSKRTPFSFTSCCSDVVLWYKLDCHCSETLVVHAIDQGISGVQSLDPSQHTKPSIHFVSTMPKTKPHQFEVQSRKTTSQFIALTPNYLAMASSRPRIHDPCLISHLNSSSSESPLLSPLFAMLAYQIPQVSVPNSPIKQT